jgi:SAM-dependent methyltransferase
MRQQHVGLGHPEGSRRAVPRAEAALVQRVPHNGRVLDIGCGRGYGLERLSSYGLRPIGLEIGRATLRDAQTRGPVFEGTADKLPFQDASFDAAMIIQVFHHVEDPPDVIHEVRRVLKPGGHFMLLETTEDSPLVRAGRTLRPDWDGVPVRSRFRTQELQRWLTDAGFTLSEEVRWGTLLVGASALGSLAPPLRRLVAACWGPDILLGRIMPFGQGFYSCLAERRR